MEPTTQIFPGRHIPFKIAGGDECKPLPYFKYEDDGQIVTRWRLTWVERLRVLLFGSLWLYIITDGEPLQPVLIKAEPPR